MVGFRLRRLIWMLLAVLAVGVVLFCAVQQLTLATPDHLNRTATALSRGREFLGRYGAWLHLSAHGLTYLYLILRWPHLVRWVDRRRVARGHALLSASEQHRLALAVVTICVAYEGLLMLRYLG